MSSPSPAPTSRPPASKKKAKAYLVAYNLLSAAGWSYILYITLAHLSNSAAPQSLIQGFVRPIYVPSYVPAALVPLYKRASTTYAAVGRDTAYVQSAAALEVLHVLFGFVRSPLPTTAMQVASRLYLVWGIADKYPAAQASPLYASMVLSWAVTEVIRYTFYAGSLVGAEPSFLVWLRYTTFYVLYPTGAGSEAFVCLTTLPVRTSVQHWDVGSLIRGLLFVTWLPGLYVMYTYMIKQRRKIYGTGRTLGAKPKSS
ncbi:PTPLA-domain-containing protein [Artomyces pyxidatus]|uniref:PTPLA-domain-containing protein n=1 Tax=Artomyces pyxidatus TaxID=48021 RepID=A0ACB8TCS1_9AGAM|nr:PTPLA-domain-containing protein [Artomyces pyxidatus]